MSDPTDKTRRGPEPDAPPAREPPREPREARESPPAEAAGLAQALEAKTRECRELVDQLQRLAAEYSNYQKRMAHRMQEERRAGVRDLTLDLLPAIDNLERTLAAAARTPEADVLTEAVRIAHRELLAALRKHGVTPIEAGPGHPFDPEHHEAIAHLPHAEHADGRVIEEVQKGYRLGDRTIRASRVAVSRGTPEEIEIPPATEAEAEAETEETPE